MKYSIGDEIVVLHSMEEGKVVELMNDKMVMIEVRGVKFPAYMDQIDFPYFMRFTKHLQKPQEPKKPVKQYVDDIRPEKRVSKNQFKVAEGVWCLFMPVFDKDVFDDDVVELFKVYLVNQTDTAYKFHYKLMIDGAIEFEHQSELRPIADFYLHNVPFEDFNDNPHFHFEFSLAEPTKNKAPFFEVSYKPKAKQLFARIEEMKLKQESFFSFHAFDVFPDKVETVPFDLQKLSGAGFKIYNAKEARKHLPPARSVVDLHIEKLLNDWQTFSNSEILDVQLKEFEKWYELAVQHYQASLIIIHGVGNGVLKDEIHDLLKLKKEVKTFVNQYDPRFGFGATEIFFQY